MLRLKRVVFISIIVTSLLIISMLNVNAGDFTLSNNSGTSSSVWFISGEASLVMNGFDLNAQGISLPARLDRVSIDVASATPGVSVDVVIYQDTNGGSPIDATLVTQTTVDITTSGVFNVDFATPVEITAPVIWVGFYLPVDFEFRADTSGSSVLTYWAWTTNARFDLNNLSSAEVLGPSDGTAPVNIDMNGIARITAELITDGTVTQPTTDSNSVVVPATSNTETIQQVQDTTGTAVIPPMAFYASCQNVYFDTEDIAITYRQGIRVFCQQLNPIYDRLATYDPDGYDRVGLLFDIYLFGVESGATRLPNPITHCVRPETSYLNTAVIGLGFGAPRDWQILPTVRFGEYICAEVYYTGTLSYFVPTN